MNKYKTNSQIKFLGPIYVIDTLNSLRYYSKIYFHGHSVGGTNPSLLEAMGCSCYIAAHNNSFNKYVLEDNAFYFNNSYDISKIIETYTETYRKMYINNNKIKIKKVYNWDNISDKHLEIFKESLLTD